MLPSRSAVGARYQMRPVHAPHCSRSRRQVRPVSHLATELQPASATQVDGTASAHTEKGSVANDVKAWTPRKTIDPREKLLQSGHPDALRRRQEAEARRKANRKMAFAEATGQGWWTANNPTNMHCVASEGEYQMRLRMAKLEEKLVFINYFAPHCLACKTLHPKLVQLAEAHPDVVFLKVNSSIAELRNLCERLDIDRLPHFHLFKGSQGLVSSFSANLNTVSQLRKELNTHKSMPVLS